MTTDFNKPDTLTVVITVIDLPETESEAIVTELFLEVLADEVVGAVERMSAHIGRLAIDVEIKES
jgi:hypothetical protein